MTRLATVVAAARTLVDWLAGERFVPFNGERRR